MKTQHKRFLYRYFRNVDHAVDTLLKRHLYHCTADELNDPFDCRPPFALKSSRDDDPALWRRLFLCFAMMQYPEQSVEEHNLHADTAIENGLHKDAKWLRELDSSSADVAPLLRLCCLTRSPRNTMMWAHYADHYRGVVLQFRCSYLYDTTSHQFRGLDVSYIDDSIRLDAYVNAIESAVYRHDSWPIAKIFHATKTRHWIQEDEVRFFSDSSRQYLDFDEPAIAGIIFGHASTDATKERILESVKQWDIVPQIYQTTVDRDRQKLWIKRTPNKAVEGNSSR